MKIYFRSLVLAAMLVVCSCSVSAQERISKDGAMLYSIGAGYEWMSDVYSPNGFSLDVRARFYTSERLFCELTGRWGTHTGEKSVMQKGKPFVIDDERNYLLAAVGPGFEFFQTADNKYSAYAKTLIGYGVIWTRYDGYQPLSDDDGQVTLGCEDRKNGLSAVVGVGFDARFDRWTLTPSVDAIYVGGRCNWAVMISVGFFY